MQNATEQGTECNRAKPGPTLENPTPYYTAGVRTAVGSRQLTYNNSDPRGHHEDAEACEHLSSRADKVSACMDLARTTAACCLVLCKASSRSFPNCGPCPLDSFPAYHLSKPQHVILMAQAVDEDVAQGSSEAEGGAEWRKRVA